MSDWRSDAPVPVLPCSVCKGEYTVTEDGRKKLCPKCYPGMSMPAPIVIERDRLKEELSEARAELERALAQPPPVCTGSRQPAPWPMVMSDTQPCQICKADVAVLDAPIGRFLQVHAYRAPSAPAPAAEQLDALLKGAGLRPYLHKPGCEMKGCDCGPPKDSQPAQGEAFRACSTGTAIDLYSDLIADVANTATRSNKELDPFIDAKDALHDAIQALLDKLAASEAARAELATTLAAMTVNYEEALTFRQAARCAFQERDAAREENELLRAAVLEGVQFVFGVEDAEHERIRQIFSDALAPSSKEQP